MTIQDLLDSGIVIQGGVIIKRWLDEVERYETLYNDDNFDLNKPDSDISNLVVTYMYADSRMHRCMVIEVE